MEANKDKMKAVRQPRHTVFDKLTCLKKVNDTLAQEVELKTEALRNATDLLIAAEDKVDELESTVKKQRGEIERLLAKICQSSEDNQLVTSSIKTVSTASQADLNIPDYNANSLRPTEAANKIRELEDQLDEKRKYITKLRNKLTSYRLRKEPNLWPNYNYLADLEEYSSAQVQGAIEVGLNDDPITKDQIRTEACFNSQDYPQLQAEQKSVHSKRTPKANSTETTCASSQLQTCIKKQTSESTAHLPVPEDEKPKLVIPEDELCEEVSSMGELWKPGRKSQKSHSEQLVFGSAPPTEADRALQSNHVSQCLTAAGSQSAALENKKKRRRRR
jgi:uncharacterized coiled-coil protein SlyX